MRQATKPTTYYLAYGSNLHAAQMRRRCPGSRRIAAAVLDDWHLVFRGVADIEPRAGSAVQAAIYSITPSDELALDRYEGYRAANPNDGLYRKRYVETVIDGKRARVMFYTMNRSWTEPPQEAYFDTILTGYHNWGIDPAPLYDALKRSERRSRRVMADAR